MRVQNNTEPLVPAGKKYAGETTLSSLWVTLWEPLLWSWITAIAGESVGSSQLKSYCGEESEKACNKEHNSSYLQCSSRTSSFAHLQNQVKVALSSGNVAGPDLPNLDPQTNFFWSWRLIGLCQEMCWVIAPPTMESDFWSHLTRRAGDHFWFNSVVLEKWAGRLFIPRAKPIPVEAPCARHNQGD